MGYKISNDEMFRNLKITNIQITKDELFFYLKNDKVSEI